ncbi:MAG: ScaI family restriction endonuclease [Microcoleus sp.]
MQSPYRGIPVQDWQEKTLELIDLHPLDPQEIYDKDKSGYYLVVNFQKFNPKIEGVQTLNINLVRFGWIDREDWQGQTAATGQQAKLSPDVERYKLLKLPI